MPFSETDKLAVQTIRALSIDAIEKANSGHPGLPMGAAPMAHVLWSRFLRFDPKNPYWINRDRFVLSAGHGSMLLYSLLHLAGYDVSIEDLKEFRQFGSKTPGHPEYGHTEGVDATTGPLGQGIGMAVGMAMAERFLASTFNRDNYDLVSHYTYALCGDGDLMEGVAAEAASLAGHLGLSRLIVLYDSNNISLDGPTDLSFTENVKQRFEAYGWNVLRVEDGNNLDEIEAAIARARSSEDRPTLIEVKTIIGYGSSKQGTSSVHGSPLGAEDAAKAKASYAWTHEAFHVPSEVYELYQARAEQGAGAEAAWRHLVDTYNQSHPEEGRNFADALLGAVRVDFSSVLPTFDGGVATRDAFAKVINAIAPHVPFLIGGSADLSGSNKTLLKDAGNFQKDNYSGRNFFFGVREHAMGAMLNGMTLHGGVIPFAGTFLVFCDYLRPSLRLSALMKQPVVHIFTHDSIAVGEDGPTHEPVEQLASLRAIPGLKVWRPADATETGLAVQYVLEHRDGPAAIALTRQKVPTLAEVIQHQGNFNRGAYILAEYGDGEDLILMASGSEVQLALGAAKELAKDGVSARVVSVPCMELFDAQDEAYKETILPKAVTRRLAIEMAHPMPWYKYVGLDGQIVGISGFGASGAETKVVESYGFTLDNVIRAARSLLT